MSGTGFAQVKIYSSTGVQSITENGGYLKTTYASGEPTILTNEAGFAGLLQFQGLRSDDLANKLYGLHDAGLVTISNQQFYKVAAVFTSSTILTSSKMPKHYQIDFYFDPATMLLEKTATPVQLSGMASNRLLQVTSYGDYREVNKP